MMPIQRNVITITLYVLSYYANTNKYRVDIGIVVHLYNVAKIISKDVKAVLISDS